MFRDSTIAAIRTGVAFIITWLLAKLFGLGVEIDTDTAAALSVALFGVAVAAYNFVVGLLERKVNPLFGILLGIPKAPAYGDVGTQTAPPSDPLIGNPRTDTPGEHGNISIIGAGVVALVIALILYLVSAASGLAYTIAIIGLILLVVGVVLRASSNKRV